ncbi:hypothetical protein AGMMS49938_05720 [Fibrobacterales bacterium]|nr:hypothetical protein AGMMS49938_05720 [Fibrobacterales bacterium]
MKSKLTIEDVLERTGWTKELEARGEAQLLQKIKKLIKQSSSLKELEAKLG